jgi:hypothetical protein
LMARSTVKRTSLLSITVLFHDTHNLIENFYSVKHWLAAGKNHRASLDWTAEGGCPHINVSL